MTEEEEGRYGFGTTIAIDAFIKHLASLPARSQVLLCVNIATLLRNTLSKFTVTGEGKILQNKDTHGLNVPEALKFTKTVMVDIANEIAAVCAQRFPDEKHHIIYYLTDPLKQLPSEWIRSQTSESALRLDAAVRSILRNAKPVDQTNNNVQMHIRYADQMRVPSYKGISEMLNGFASYHVPVHLISHMPLDYHIKFYSGRDGILYRSHTGEMVQLTSEALSKTVFKEPSLPFYPVTHVLLGDKYLVKGCLPKKERDRFIELAKANHWNLRTSDYIIQKIKENNFTLPYRLG